MNRYVLLVLLAVVVLVLAGLLNFHSKQVNLHHHENVEEEDLGGTSGPEIHFRHLEDGHRQ